MGTRKYLQRSRDLIVGACSDDKEHHFLPTGTHPLAIRSSAMSKLSDQAAVNDGILGDIMDNTTGHQGDLDNTVEEKKRGRKKKGLLLGRGRPRETAELLPEGARL